MVKKSICVILSLLMVFGAVICANAADDGSLSFAVASDLHFNFPREELAYDIDDPVYFYANRRAAMEDETGFIIDEFLNECAANDDVEFVLISGDMADHGRTIPEEHMAVAEKFRAFEQQTGKQIYVINGNHDCSENEGDTSFAEFRSIYDEFGYNEAKDTLGALSYTADLGSKYRLIALDSCDESKSTEDGMSTEKVQWVCDMAKKAKAEGRYPILMMHHNLLDHMPLQRIFSRNFIIRFHYSTAELFADAGIKFVFTGHEHCSDAVSYTSALGNTVTDFATTSLTMYPLSYRLVKMTDEAMTYAEKKVEKIDTDALTAGTVGYTDEQIQLMNDDLDAYAKGFLKKGIEYRLSLSLSMEKIGIAEGEAFYNLVNTAVTGLTDLLEMPLYGENGVQALAKEYNIDLPDSDYETGWDLATDLVSWHYAGSEPFDLDSTEVVMLLKMVDLILLDDLSTVNDEVFLSAANSLFEQFGTSGICGELTRLGAKVLGPVTAGEYFLLALVSPILYTFATDKDGVDDNNGTLPGYGTVNASQRLNSWFTNFVNQLSKWIRYLMMNLSYVAKIFTKAF